MSEFFQRKIILPLFWFGSVLLAVLTSLWIREHGFWGGIWFWLKSAQLDPMYATVVVDFSLLMLVLGFYMLRDFPAKKNTIWFWLWCVLFFLAPSLAFLIYLIWIKKIPLH